MRKVCSLFAAVIFMVLPTRSQTQDQSLNSMTVSEFRQALIDLGTYLDTRKGTNFVSQFEAAPDEVLERLLQNTPNPRRFQNAANQLKNSLDPSSLASSAARLRANAIPALSANASQYPSCPSDTIIDDSSGAVCTPSYPLPTSPDWQNLVNPLFPINALPSPNNGDYSNVVNQTCNTDVETGLDISVSALYGTVNAAAVACGILDNVPIGYQVCYGVVAGVAVAGAVTQGLLNDCFEQDNNVVFAQSDAAFHNTVTIYDFLQNVGGAVTNVLNNTSATETNTSTLLVDYSTVNTNLTNIDTNLSKQVGQVDTDVKNVGTNVVNTGTNLANQLTTLDSDLKQTGTSLSTQISVVDQDVVTRATKIDTEISTEQALELRLQIEANLGSSTSTPVGLFEVPQAKGGYLELARSIAGDIYNKMISIGVPVNPQATFGQIDVLISQGFYELAYQQLRQTYQLLIQPY